MKKKNCGKANGSLSSAKTGRLRTWGCCIAAEDWPRLSGFWGSQKGTGSSCRCPIVPKFQGLRSVGNRHKGRCLRRKYQGLPGLEARDGGYRRRNHRSLPHETHEFSPAAGGDISAVVSEEPRRQDPEERTEEIIVAEPFRRRHARCWKKLLEKNIAFWYLAYHQ